LSVLGADVALVIDPGSRAVLVEADPGQLEQVLLEAVAEARAGLPHGGRLDVRVRMVNGCARLTVGRAVTVLCP
jgi:hypothetical protein